MEKGFAGTDDIVGMGTLLTWMQEKKSACWWRLPTEVRALPPELLRRRLMRFSFGPSTHVKLEILDIHLRQRNRNPEQFDLTVVVEESEGIPGRTGTSGRGCNV